MAWSHLPLAKLSSGLLWLRNSKTIGTHMTHKQTTLGEEILGFYTLKRLKLLKMLCSLNFRFWYILISEYSQIAKLNSRKIFSSRVLLSSSYWRLTHLNNDYKLRTGMYTYNDNDNNLPRVIRLSHNTTLPTWIIRTIMYPWKKIDGYGGPYMWLLFASHTFNDLLLTSTSTLDWCQFRLGMIRVDALCSGPRSEHNSKLLMRMIYTCSENVAVVIVSCKRFVSGAWILIVE